MKTKVFSGLIALGIFTYSCTVEELQNEDYKLNSNTVVTQEHYDFSTDSTSTNITDYDTGGGGDNPGGDD